MASSNISDALCTQLDQTEGLVRQVYQGCAGLSSSRHLETSKLVKTYHEIERKLVKSFPEHPGSIDLVKVNYFEVEEVSQICCTSRHAIKTNTLQVSAGGQTWS